jgi:hypothetical protein
VTRYSQIFLKHVVPYDYGRKGNAYMRHRRCDCKVRDRRTGRTRKCRNRVVIERISTKPAFAWCQLHWGRGAGG